MARVEIPLTRTSGEVKLAEVPLEEPPPDEDDITMVPPRDGPAPP